MQMNWAWMALGLALLCAWLFLGTYRAGARARRAERRLAEERQRAGQALQQQIERRTQVLQQEVEARKAIELSLQKALDEQTQRLADYSDANAMMSHELRTPLAIIDTASQSLQMLELGQVPEAALRIQRIRNAVLRLDSLANGLSSMERLEQSSARRDFNPIDLAECVRQVAGVYASEQTINLELESQPVIVGDASLLNIALSNLVGNAVKYAGRYGPIDIRLYESGNQAHVQVRDHGPGIAETDLVHIFKRFFRSEGSHHQAGAGQGLFLTRRISEMHQGSLAARNLPQGGCEFVLTLPLAP